MSTDIPNRRLSDAQLAEHERRIKKYIADQFEEHREDEHLGKIHKEKARMLIDTADKRATEHNQLKIDVAHLLENQAHILDEVVGEKVYDITGEWFGERTGGMKGDLSSLKSQSENGGIRAKLSKKDRVLIALAPSLALVAVAFIQAFG